MTKILESCRDGIAALAKGKPRMTFMEVCGTHTMQIYRYGLRQLLPENVRLVSGPGCPVCVTAQSSIACALRLAQLPNVIFTCFGDMLRVPCLSPGQSLYRLMEDGCDVRVVTSPMDSVELARGNPEKTVVFFAVGFETTAPLTAAAVLQAQKEQLSNFCIYCAHKTMPNAIRSVLQNAAGEIQGLLCPGHVAALTGSRAFDFVPAEFGVPAAVAGFEAEDLLLAILRLTYMNAANKARCENLYPRAVRETPNETALGLLRTVFVAADASWRGLGVLPQSGLVLREAYAAFDAARRFDITPDETVDAQVLRGCRCADVICGKLSSRDCPLFGRGCTPQNPCGPCMVSSEGACAAAYQYGQ